jgi:hypothetical protein
LWVVLSFKEPPLDRVKHVNRKSLPIRRSLLDLSEKRLAFLPYPNDSVFQEEIDRSFDWKK